MKTLLIKLLKFYQRWVSPLSPPRCRFQPTCSSYFLEAVQLHGALKGSWLGTRRLLKCHPLHSGGYDPCPEQETDSGCRRPHGHANTDNV